jgi:hypothetical protein
MNGEIILTPGGFRWLSQVHLIEKGHVVRKEDKTTFEVNLATRSMKSLGVAMAGPPDKSLNEGGWIADARWLNATGTPVSLFISSWQVPPAPARKAEQTIYLFNGLQNIDSNPCNILQPVLQWGINQKTGERGWFVASWYVMADGVACHSEVVKVDEGKQLIGVMSLLNNGAGVFFYECYFGGIDGSYLAVESISELNECVEAFEAYNFTDELDFPNSINTDFTQIQIRTKTVYPKLLWVTENLLSMSPQKAQIINDSSQNGEVKISYRKI